MPASPPAGAGGRPGAVPHAKYADQIRDKHRVGCVLDDDIGIQRAVRSGSLKRGVRRGCGAQDDRIRHEAPPVRDLVSARHLRCMNKDKGDRPQIIVPAYLPFSREHQVGASFLSLLR
jgi:hypothetical protein